MCQRMIVEDIADELGVIGQNKRLLSKRSANDAEIVDFAEGAILCQPIHYMPLCAQTLDNRSINVHIGKNV